MLITHNLHGPSHNKFDLCLDEAIWLCRKTACQWLQNLISKLYSVACVATFCRWRHKITKTEMPFWRDFRHWLHQFFCCSRPFLAFGYCCLRLCVCVCLGVCPSVCQSRACPRDNSWPVQARVTKFGPNVQNILVKGQLTLIFKVKFHFKIKFYAILSLKFVRAITHHPFKIFS